MKNRHDKARLLLIEDDPHVVEVVSEVAAVSGYQIDTRREGVSGTAAARDPHYDLIILDIMLPGKDGWEICRELRREGNDIPIIMLTALTSESDRVSGLTMGADDYVTKPFSPRELIARIEAVLKRYRSYQTAPAHRRSTLVFCELDLSIDVVARTVRVGNHELDFAPREFDLITYLARNPDRAVSRTEILELVWSDQNPDDTRTVAEHIKRIRRRLEAAGIRRMPIQTVWGMGYRFSTSGSPR